MLEERYRREIQHLLRLKEILEHDTVLPLRIEIRRQSLGFRRFIVTITGIRSVVLPRSGVEPSTANRFVVEVSVPSGYPHNAIPHIRFQAPIPYHPHVYRSGEICWGTGNTPQLDLWLADWIRAVIEYLQYNQDPGSALRINPRSPANGEALRWWRQHQRSLRRYVPPIDMGRLRRWIDATRGE